MLFLLPEDIPAAIDIGGEHSKGCLCAARKGY
jgi:hypothetical protein